MIPQSYITAWRKKAPWQENYQVEQDLVIERALIELFNDEYLKQRLAFRGGTALHKLHLPPAARYSEDIDLVQVNPSPFGSIIDKIRERLNFLGSPRINQKLHNNTVIFKFASEENIPLKLKVEVNTREHFTVYGLQSVEIKVESDWATGKAFVPTYSLEELLATKLRALYQRKKGRDLFDLWYALHHATVDTKKLITAFNRYMEEEGHIVSQKEFIENMNKKIITPDFRQDMSGLLRPNISYNIDEAYNIVENKILKKI